MTFPFGYKFLTLHGKYPDISELEDGEYPPSYWDEIPCFEFKYDNDYPVPINPSTNSTPVSYYILDRCVLTIEPYVIIMDAQFSGTDANDKSVIRLDTNHTYGNWTYDTATVRLVPLLYTFENCVPFAIENNGNQIKTSTETKYTPVSLLKIFRSGTPIPQIQILIEQPANTYIKVYDSFGKLVSEKYISSMGQIINYSDLPRGIYHAVLVKNGEIVEKQSLAKM